MNTIQHVLTLARSTQRSWSTGSCKGELQFSYRSQLMNVNVVIQLFYLSHRFDLNEMTYCSSCVGQFVHHGDYRSSHVLECVDT